MISRLNRFERAIDRWIARPERNAAGRLGLFRILYAGFMLMLALPPNAMPNIANAPADLWQPVPILIWMQSPPSTEFLLMLDVMLVVSLIFLLIGFRVRMMTLLVLISATLLASAKYSFSKIDHSDTFLNTYIPMIMLFAPWGATYSLDAYLRYRRGLSIPSVSDDSLRYSWPFPVVLWLLAIMFMVSGLLKAIPPGQWLVDPELLRKFMKESNKIENPDQFRYMLGMLPTLPLFMLQLMAVIFETFYPLAVINTHWRKFYVSSTVFFHVGTRITLGIWFMLMLPVYAFFFDIQTLYDRFFPKFILRPFGRVLSKVPSWGLITLAFAVVGMGVVIHFDHDVYLAVFAPIRARVLSDNLWYLAIILAVYGIATSLPHIIAPMFNRKPKQPHVSLPGVTEHPLH